MRNFALVLVTVLAGLAISVGFAPSAGAGCVGASSLKSAHGACVQDGGGSSSAYYVPVCSSETVACLRRVKCSLGKDRPGIRMVKVTGGVRGAVECHLAHESMLRRMVTPGLVLTAMRRLSWPASALIIQPPKGVTLVNFRTNFLTANSKPTTQTVVLLGQRISIEARPSSYTWNFGDESESLTTTRPGRRYPHLDITHQYLRKGTYEPSVDTTYSGRYRVNGGRWITVPGTLTVDGASVSLKVIGATPTLVGSPDGD